MDPGWYSASLSNHPPREMRSFELTGFPGVLSVPLPDSVGQSGPALNQVNGRVRVE